MSFYHSDDARAMASLAKANNAALYQNNAGLQNNYQTYPNTTSVPVPPPPRGPAPTKRTPRWNWASTIFACIGTCLCCSICSVMGLFMSGLAYADHKSGDYDRSRRKTCWSWLCTAIAFVIGIGILAFFIVMVAAFADEAENWWNDAKNWLKDRACDAGFKDQCR